MSRYLIPALCGLAALTATAPALADCAADISRFQKLLDRDLKTGFVAASVHQKASGDLAEAGKLCKAGQDAAASGAVAASRARFGYPP